MISLIEQEIIISAISKADSFGGGRLSYAEEAIKDSGIEWTPAHEQFVFEYDDLAYCDK